MVSRVAGWCITWQLLQYLFGVAPVASNVPSRLLVVAMCHTCSACHPIVPFSLTSAADSPARPCFRNQQCIGVPGAGRTRWLLHFHVLFASPLSLTIAETILACALEPGLWGVQHHHYVTLHTLKILSVLATFQCFRSPGTPSPHSKCSRGQWWWQVRCSGC